MQVFMKLSMHLQFLKSYKEIGLSKQKDCGHAAQEKARIKLIDIAKAITILLVI